MDKSWITESVPGHLWRLHKLYRERKKWRKNNSHNGTILESMYDAGLVTVGNESYGELNVVSFGKESKLHIGNYVSIAQNVSFLLDVEHHTDRISTFPFEVKLLQTKEYEAFGKGDIIVDDDVWIGYRATILSGVHIGQGAVIAAGAVVTKDVSPYAVVGGVPAKFIKYRFGPDIISELMKLDYSKIKKEFVEENLEILKKESPLIDEIIRIRSLLQE